MELCGKNLSDWLRHPGITIDSIFIQLKQIKIIEGIVSGLKFLHSNKIIHRNLKPANIMFHSKYAPHKNRRFWSVSHTTQ